MKRHSAALFQAQCLSKAISGRSPLKKVLLLFIAFVLLTAALFDSPAERPATAATSAQSTDNYVFLRSWGSDAWTLGEIAGVAVAPDGVIYAISTAGCVLRVGPGGERTVTVWGSWGYGIDKFNDPRGVAVDGSGNVYVTDNNNRIQKYNSAGRYQTEWGGRGAYNGQFYTPTGVAADDSGNVYVADYGNARVQKFSSAGAYLTKWGSYGAANGQFKGPQGVAVDGSGNVYVADSGNHRIQKFTSAGAYVTQWGSYGAANGQFKGPQGVAVDGNGNVFVADSGNQRIQKFTSAGAYLTQWGSFGSGIGQFNNPSSVAVSASGNVFVTDYNNHIQKFTSAGEYLTQWGYSSASGQFSGPQSVAVDGSGNVYVADTKNQRIQKFTNAGAYLIQWGSFGSGAGQFKTPYDVTLGDGALVADGENHRIQKFALDGKYLAEWGSQGSSDGYFQYPAGVVVDSDGNAYVTDTGNNRIQKFTGAGGYLTQWGSFGSAPYQFNSPGDVAVVTASRGGYVYVADTGNDRIQWYTWDGVYYGQWGSTGSDIGQFNGPRGVAADGMSYVYVADANNNRIQKFTKSGTYVTQWGDPWRASGFGVGQFSGPNGVAVDGDGKVYVADTGNNRIQVFSTAYPTPDPTGNVAFNGSFEDTPALAHWTYGGTLSVTITDTWHTDGASTLQLGMPVPKIEQGEGQAWAYQTVYIDPTWVRPMLSFDYTLFVNDTIQASDFFVAIQDGVGLSHLATVLHDGFDSCTNREPKARQPLTRPSVTFDLSAYRGQSVRVVFANRNLYAKSPDRTKYLGSQGIWSFVDNVRVADAGPLPPAGPYHLRLPMVSYHRCDPITAAGVSELSAEPNRIRPSTP